MLTGSVTHTPLIWGGLPRAQRSLWAWSQQALGFGTEGTHPSRSLRSSQARHAPGTAQEILEASMPEPQGNTGLALSPPCPEAEFSPERLSAHPEPLPTKVSAHGPHGLRRVSSDAMTHSPPGAGNLRTENIRPQCKPRATSARTCHESPHSSSHNRHKVGTPRAPQLASGW